MTLQRLLLLTLLLAAPGCDGLLKDLSSTACPCGEGYVCRVDTARCVLLKDCLGELCPDGHSCAPAGATCGGETADAGIAEAALDASTAGDASLPADGATTADGGLPPSPGCADAGGICENGWTLEEPRPLGDATLSAWATGPDDFWFAAQGQGIYRTNGVKLSRLPNAPLTNEIFGGFGTAADDAWAVGDGSAHWDGSGWTFYPTRFPTIAGWTGTKGTAWAVANDSNTPSNTGGKIYRFAGGAWMERMITGAGALEQMVSITGSGTGTNEELFVGSDAGHVFHFDGTIWTLETPLPALAEIKTIAKVGTEVYAGTAAGTVAKRAGGTWSAIARVGSLPIYSIFGAASGVYAADLYTLWKLNASGTSWDVALSNAARDGAAFGTTAFSVGFNETTGFYLAHLENKVFTVHRPPSQPLVEGFIAGVSLGPAGAWAVGRQGTLAHRDPLMPGWKDDASGVRTELFDIWGQGTELWAVGAGGTLLHKSGGSGWTAVALTLTPPVTQDLRGVSGNSTTDVFVVGTGVILHLVGTTWRSETCPVSPCELLAVQANGSEESWAVGARGLVLRRTQQGTWTKIDTKNVFIEDLLTVYASGGLVLIGGRGTLARYDSSSGSFVRIFAGSIDFQGIGSDGTSVYAVGEVGTVVPITSAGLAGVPIAVPSGHYLTDVFGSPGGPTFITSFGGRVMSHP